MCGIAGVIGDGWTRWHFDRLSESVRHRGPDSSGSYEAANLKVAMHRLHLRGPTAEVPLHSGDSVVSFNGQVYFARAAPSAPWWTPKSLEEEIAAIGSLDVDGMYACAVAAGDGSAVLLATDPDFIKPLFYLEADEGVAFCSELAGLANLQAPRHLNQDALVELFAYGWYLSNQTYLDGISMVHGNGVQVRSGKVTILPQPRPAFDSTTGLARRALRAAIRDSVRACIDGRGPIGLAVSGGLDSTILAWELNAAGLEDLVTVSMCSDDGDGIHRLEELSLPRGGVWRSWRHRTVNLDRAGDFIRHLETSVGMFCQPSTMSSLPLSLRVAQAAAEEGVRILLSGEGVDELFAGYSSYRKMRGLGSVLDYYRHPAREQLVRILFGNHAFTRAQRRLSEVYGGERDLRRVEREMRLTRLLLRTDVCWMSQSIEGRVPFLHRGIPEAALATPWRDLQVGLGKAVLRRAYATDLGGRTTTPKVRFKASDRVLRRCIVDESVQRRLRDALVPLFGERATTQCLMTLETSAGFDADICMLLLSLMIIMESGLIK